MEVDINNKVFCNQWPIVRKFVQSYTYYNVLHTHYQENKLESAFWTKTIDVHLQMAVIDWCKVFGAHGANNQLHWKKTGDDLTKKELDNFRQMIYEHTGFSKRGWEDYNLKMRNFRDTYVAHYDITDPQEPVPYFLPALLVAYAYDDWVRELLLLGNIPAEMESPPLIEYAENFKEELFERLEKLI